MVNMCLLSIIMIFCVFGIYFLTKEITSFILKNDVTSQVIIEIQQANNNVEEVIRSALNANPNSVVSIINNSNNEEIQQILYKLSCDNDRIDIKTAPEK